MLNWIYRSLQSFPVDERNTIEDAIIQQFSQIPNRDKIPIKFLTVASAAYKDFISCYNWNRSATWPQVPNPDVRGETMKVAPTASQIKDKLGGDSLVDLLVANRMDLFESRREDGMDNSKVDKVRVALSAFLPDED